MNIFGGRPGIAAGVLAVIATLAAIFLMYWIKVAILIAVIVYLSAFSLILRNLFSKRKAHKEKATSFPVNLAKKEVEPEERQAQE